MGVACKGLKLPLGTEPLRAGGDRVGAFRNRQAAGARC